MITIKWKRGAPTAALVIAYERIKRRGYKVNFVNADEWRVFVP